MSLMQLLMFQTARVNITSDSPTGRNNGARIVLDGSWGLNGTSVNYTLNGVDSTRYTWVLSGTPSDYQIKATLTAGSLLSGTTGTWLNCNTNPLWSINAATYSSATLTMEIRDAVTSVVLDTSTIDMTTNAA